ncbi:MAG: DNA-3-methyladenine glycosylase [Anaerolineae bacterium]|nr:DNA-3-methyladenine glycosylase [Anaerolineae bacterium]
MIKQDFFAQPTLTVARMLLGQRLAREIEGHYLSGLIVETEAYIGPFDTASHASKGRTPRTEIMFGPPARAYIYLVYGMHYMLNVVTEPLDFPAAVLIRAIEPTAGVAVMQANRRGHPANAPNLTNGPAKLCQALAIDKTLNNWDMTLGQKLWLEFTAPIPEARIATGSRIGIDYAQPQDQIAPWRFWLKGNRFVSR